MLKISEKTLTSFNASAGGDFRKRAIAYVYKKGIVRPDISDAALNKVLKFTEECSADAKILAEQSRLTLFVLGIRHGCDWFYDDEVTDFMTDTRIPERIRVRKLVEFIENKSHAVI